MLGTEISNLGDTLFWFHDYNRVSANDGHSKIDWSSTLWILDGFLKLLHCEKPIKVTITHVDDHVHEWVETAKDSRHLTISIEFQIHFLVHVLFELWRVRLTHFAEKLNYEGRNRNKTVVREICSVKNGGEDLSCQSIRSLELVIEILIDL